MQMQGMQMQVIQAQNSQNQACSSVQLRLGYLVNQYPKVSHSFIRREIAALETEGISVVRFSIRTCQDELIDPLDQEELQKTRVLFQPQPGGWLGNLGWIWDWVVAIALVFLHTPLGWLRTLLWSLQLGGQSDTGRVKHVAYFAEACLLRRCCALASVNHLHVHFGTNSTMVAMLCRQLGGPSYSFTVHGPEEFDRASGLALRPKIAQAAFVVAISSYGRSQLYRQCDYEQWSKIHRVHCGVDQPFLQPPTLPPPMVYPPDRPRLVCVGRLCEQKGQLLLVEAIQHLKQRGHFVDLVLVGDGPLRSPLEQLIAQYNLQDQIQITGWASSEQVRSQLLSAQALVLPSFAEGLPVVLMEALALGRPVLSTYVAGIPELVEPGVNGWLVPAGSMEALVQGLETLLATPREKRWAMGLAGHEAIAQRHNITLEAQRLAALFAQTQKD